jgi:hypothetical protein
MLNGKSVVFLAISVELATGKEKIFVGKFLSIMLMQLCRKLMTASCG